MAKSLFIAEKPSVAREFANALKVNGRSVDGYIESENAVVTWCVGHLVTMSYPEVYDMKYKRWSLETLPFLPKEWKYQVIDSVKKQFGIVSGLLNRADVDTIYVCTDSARDRSASGSIHRRRKRFCAASAKRRICPNTIIWRIRHICGQKKII